MRGLNLGAHRRVPMAGLREALARAGHPEARTLGQSGNVVLASAEEPDAVARGIEDLRSGRQTLRDREEVIAGVVSGAYDAGGARLSNAEFVDRVIRNAHGAPDPVASAYYTAQLDAGAGTLADVLHAYAFSPGIDARVAPYITDHGLVFA